MPDRGRPTRGALRAAPLVRAKVKITVKNAVCEESSATAYGVFDWAFGFFTRTSGTALREVYKHEILTGD